MKETFISRKTPSECFGDKASPQFYRRRLNPNRKGAMPCRNEGVGLQLRAHTCGLDAVKSELGFDVCGYNLPPNPEKANCEYKNRHPRTITECITPVDPAGPHCYRDRTKTC